MSALISFLGGSVFRMLWSEISGFVNKRQDHEHEIELLKLQAELEDKAASRQMESAKLQAELGFKTVEVQSQSAVDKADADAFGIAMAQAFKPTGFMVVDIWNGIIRPSAATIVLFLWVSKLMTQGFKMEPWDMEICGVVLGFFFADRSIKNRGK